MSPSLEDLTRLVSLLLGAPTVHADDRLVEDLGAESADLVNLIATVEDKYQVVLDEEAVARVHTVADLQALVNQSSGQA
jgi:acyl carrier protein